MRWKQVLFPSQILLQNIYLRCLLRYVSHMINKHLDGVVKSLDIHGSMYADYTRIQAFLEPKEGLVYSSLFN